jgi:hypothetical protein
MIMRACFKLHPTGQRLFGGGKLRVATLPSLKGSTSMKTLIRPLDEAKDDIKMLRLALRIILDEATAPTGALAVAESRLRLCAAYAKTALKMNRRQWRTP